MRLLDKFVYWLYATQVTVMAHWPLVPICNVLQEKRNSTCIVFIIVKMLGHRNEVYLLEYGFMDHRKMQ